MQRKRDEILRRCSRRRPPTSGPFPDETDRFHSRSFVVDALATAVDVSKLLADERAISRDHRSWTVAAIEQADQRFLASRLPQLLRSILAGTHLLQPIVLCFEPGVVP